jgi:hypothetical protein
MRRILSLSSVLICAALSGCQALQLENRTVRMSRTLTDLQYRQVMDNLALLADQPSAMPFFSVAQTGKTTIQQNTQGSSTVSWDLITVAGRLFDKVLFDKGGFGLQYNQQNIEEWDTTPALDPVQLILMQGLYRKALGYPIPFAQQQALDTFFAPPTKEKVNTLTQAHKNYMPEFQYALYDLYTRIDSGRIFVGRHHEAPKDACYVGRHGHTLAWVTSDGMDSLTALSIAVLDVATADTSGLTAVTRARYFIPPQAIAPNP